MTHAPQARAHAGRRDRGGQVSGPLFLLPRACVLSSFWSLPVWGQRGPTRPGRRPGGRRPAGIASGTRRPLSPPTSGPPTTPMGEDITKEKPARAAQALSLSSYPPPPPTSPSVSPPLKRAFFPPTRPALRFNRHTQHCARIFLARRGWQGGARPMGLRASWLLLGVFLSRGTCPLYLG